MYKKLNRDFTTIRLHKLINKYVQKVEVAEINK